MKKPPRMPVDHLVEPLTRREREILLLLADNLTNREIAARLTLTPDSVKWYTKQIYGKLGTNDRRQAVTHAQELGLLRAPHPAAALPASYRLPAQLTSFVGREEQVAEVSEMITGSPSRLLTLVGAGGVGKTRLALVVAEEVKDYFPDGVWLVELASLSDAELVPQVVSRVLGLSEDKEHPPLVLLQKYLQDKKLLLVLDNCEQLIEACARLGDALLRACPDLHVLVTSREELNIDGEISYVVPSLSFPDPRQLPAVGELANFDAVRLFIERAGAASPGYSLSEGNARDISAICQRLDGIPLALELAAARVKLLSVEQISLRLKDNFQLLAGRSRTALPRHKTMRASIEWSYHLLTSAEQTLFQQLSVFSGGWTLEAAEAVDVELGKDMIDLLAELVDKSLVQARPGKDSEIRFSLLGTIQQYAFEKLLEAGKEERIRNRHLDYYLKLAEAAEPRLRGPGQVACLDQLKMELDNLRSALAWALQTRPDAGLRIAAALMLLWQNRGRWSEGLHWLSQGLALKEKITGDQAAGSLAQSTAWILAKALSTAGFLLEEQWDDAKAKAMFEESLALYQEFDPENDGGMAFALYGLGVCAYDLGDFAGAMEWFNRSRGLYEKIGDRWGGSECLFFMAKLEKDPGVTKGILQEILTVKKEIGDMDGIAYALKHLSIDAYNLGDLPGAQSLAEESLDLFRVEGNKQSEAKMLNHLGSIFHLQGDYLRAAQLHEEAMAIYKNIGDEIHGAFRLIDLGRLCLSRGDFEEARLDIENALHTVQQTGNKPMIGRAKLNNVWLRWLEGDGTQAAKEIEKALEFGRETGYKPVLAFGYYLSGLLASSDGNLNQAALMLKESFKIYLEIHNSAGRTDVLEALAILAIHEQKPERAARLFGAANFPYNGLYINLLSPVERKRREEALRLIRQLLGEECFTKNWQEGVMMTPAQTEAYALAG